MARLTSYVRGAFGVGTLGCFNPASRAGGVPSLHADGRAEDHAVDAFRDFDRGWRLFTWLIANADIIQLQEALYAGYLWSCKNRHLGIRGPGIQQAAHMNHVHDGISYYAADNFVVAWLGGAAPDPSPEPPEEDDLPYSEADLVNLMYHARATSGLSKADREGINKILDNRGLNQHEKAQVVDAVYHALATSSLSPTSQAAVRKIVDEVVAARDAQIIAKLDAIDAKLGVHG